MKLKLSDLGCRVLDLSTSDAPPLILKLRDLESGTGELEFREGLSLLEEIAVRQVLAEIEIPFGQEGRLYTATPGTISHLTCDGRIRNGFAGEFRAAIIDSEAFAVEVPGVKARGHLIAENLLLKLDGRGGRLQVGTLTLEDAQCTVQGGAAQDAGVLLLRLASLTISGLKVEWDEGRPRIVAQRAHARGLQLHTGPTQLAVSAMDLESFSMNEAVEVEQLSVDGLDLQVSPGPVAGSDPDLGGPEVPEDSLDEFSETSVIDPMALLQELPPMELDPSVFDTINGRLDVDATLSVTLPVIGKRVATHHFRIPIEGGIIDYEDFENGLADLEDAFLNLRVRKGNLVLERDIPLIPGLEKPLVVFPLEEGEVELAKKRLVRVASLTRAKLVGEKEEETPEKKSKVKLHRLDFDNIAVDLSLDETAVLRSGEGWLRAHGDNLELRGALHWDPDPDEDGRMTTLQIKGSGLGIDAKELTVLGHSVSSNFTVGSVESCVIHFDELRPRGVQLSLKNLAFGGVVFTL